MKASDLIKELKNSPEYQAKMKKKDQEFSERKGFLAADESGLVTELRRHGFQIESVWDFINNNNRNEFLRRFEGTYEEAYPILVKHLQINHHSRIREGIIRALTVKSANQVAADVLISEFYQEGDPDLKWVFSNALRTVLTPAQKRKHPEYKDIYNGKELP